MNNLIVKQLYEFQKYCDLDLYYEYKQAGVDTIGWRLYSLTWKWKYFWNLLVYKSKRVRL